MKIFHYRIFCDPTRDGAGRQVSADRRAERISYQTKDKNRPRRNLAGWLFGFVFDCSVGCGSCTAPPSDSILSYPTGLILCSTL